MLASMCQLQALEQMAPGRSLENVTIGATSGGIIGTSLYHTAGPQLGFPPSWMPSELGSDAHLKLKERYGPVWMGAIVDVLQPLFADSEPLAKRESRNWWTATLAIAARLYGTKGSSLVMPKNLVATVTLVRESIAPLRRDQFGVVLNATTNLLAAEIHGVDGMLRVVGESSQVVPPLDLSGDTITATAYGTSFWAAPILESQLAFESLKRLLPVPYHGFLPMDGGTLDSTGLAALVRRKATHIVAFYNDAIDLHAYSAQLGFVFGMSERTTPLSMWEGPELGQLFDAKWWDVVRANLSDPYRGVVRLTNLSVRPNPFLGIEGNYMVKSLVILATQWSEPFMRAFDDVDPDVRQALHTGWPEAQPLAGMDPLNANALCVLSGWRVQKNEQLVREVLGWK